MDAGVLELVAIFMSLSGFGVDANPKAPNAAEVTKYSVSDADYSAYVDLEAFVPRNFKAFVTLPQQKPIKKNPRARKALAGLVKNAQAGRMLVSGMLGIDPIKDIKSVAVWIKIGASGLPTGVVSVRGNFPLNLVSRISTMTQASTNKINGHPVVSAPGNQAMLAFIKSDSVILVGTPALVKARLAKKWRRPRARRGSAAAKFAGLLKQKPFFALASSPTAAATTRINRELRTRIGLAGPGKFIGEVLTGHTYAALAGFSNGIGWAWTDRSSAAGYQRAVLASEGILALFRAMHFGARGAAKVMLTVVDSYASMDPRLAMIVKHKKDILALVNQVTGSGGFKVTMKKQPRTRSLTVRATGKSFSDVVPMAGLVPLIAAGAFFGSEKKEDKRAVSSSKHTAGAPMAAAPSGLQIKRTYRRVKAEKLHVKRRLRN